MAKRVRYGRVHQLNILTSSLFPKIMETICKHLSW